jgi:hypothetical protein
VSSLIYNLPILVAVSVLLWFTRKNASYSSGNEVCAIIAPILALFSIEFPKTIHALLDKLGVVKRKHKDLEVKVACVKCSKVYNYQACIVPDPTHPGRFKSRLCRDSIYLEGPPCSVPLLELTRLDRTGEKIYHSSPKQRYVCPGT